MSGVTYLCSPYSHADPLIREHRFYMACAVAARLMQEGEAVFSPIAHSHPIEQHFQRGIEGFDFWMQMDIPILKHCAAVKVLCLDGWEQSRGIARELAIAKSLYLPISYIDP